MRLGIQFSLVALLASAGIAPSPGLAQVKPEEHKLKAGDRDPELLKNVNAAITRGVDYLKRIQLGDGSWASNFDEHLHGCWRNGMTALCLLALLRCGVSPVDEQIERGFKYLREKWDNWKAGGSILHEGISWKQYEVSVTLMAIEARWSPPLAFLREKIQGTPLAGGGGRAGKLNVPPKDLEWVKQLAEYLHEHYTVASTSMATRKTGKSTVTTQVEVKGAWSYPTKNKATQSDRSNTQYAVLGLQAADRCGVPTDPEVWKGVLKNFLEFQDKKGEKRVPRIIVYEDKKNPGYIMYKTIGSMNDEARGWSYYCGKWPDKSGDEWGRAIGSMTAVGVAVVALCMDQVQRKGKMDGSDQRDGLKAIADGLAWLDMNWAVDKVPFQEPDHQAKYLYYYLYAVERAAVLTDSRLIGAHDWYREGAEHCLKSQSGDGSWTADHEGQQASTCFALLFLTKATVPVNINVHVTGGH